MTFTTSARAYLTPMLYPSTKGLIFTGVSGNQLAHSSTDGPPEDVHKQVSESLRHIAGHLDPESQN
jgi:hypothetical protein